MGFLRDMKKLSDQGKQVREAYPVQDLLAQAKQGMSDMNDVLGTLTDRTNAGPITDGIHATATILSARQSGAMVNFNPLVELQLLVEMPGGVPLPVTHSAVVLQLHLARAQQGQRIHVLVDRADPTRLAIDWVTPV